ncbi:hypothetical protein D3C84_1143830 [compost metagenome]
MVAIVGLDIDRRPCLAMSANRSRAGLRFFSSPPLASAAANTPLAAWAAVLTSPMETLYLPSLRSAHLVGASEPCSNFLLTMKAMVPV